MKVIEHINKATDPIFSFEISGDNKVKLEGPLNSESESLLPFFSWNPIKSVSTYTLTLASDEGMQTIIFVNDANEEFIQYPTAAPPLKNGIKYYWYVIARDGNGNPIGDNDASGEWIKDKFPEQYISKYYIFSAEQMLNDFTTKGNDEVKKHVNVITGITALSKIKDSIVKAMEKYEDEKTNVHRTVRGINTSEYDEIINDYDITTYPKDYDEADTRVQMKIMQEELADYLEEASEIYFHHPDPQKSLLSAVLTKATFRSKPGDHLSVTIFNSTCLVNQKRRVGDHEVFTENPVEDRMRYPDFYRLYEGPMDRSILLNIQGLSSKVTEANRQIDSNIESISVRENWIREDKRTIKKHPSLAEFKDGSESINDRIKRYNGVIEEFKKEITEQRTKIKRFEQEINVSKKQQKAQKVVKTLDAQVLQPGTKRKGQLRRKKKKKKGKKKKDSKRRRNRYTHRR